LKINTENDAYLLKTSGKHLVKNRFISDKLRLHFEREVEPFTAQLTKPHSTCGIKQTSLEIT
jgi:hypothetical protein